MVREPVLYPRLYPWLLLLATVDVLLTWLILSPSLGGMELNPIAAHFIDQGGLTGAALLKYSTVAFVMWASEFIGRKRLETGRRVLWMALVCHIGVVALASVQLVLFGA